MNPSKAKGTAGETRVVGYLREHGFSSAHRKPLTGNRDQGDVQVTPWLIAEVKTHRATPSRAQVVEWLDQTETERGNAAAPEGVLILIRHGLATGRAWVVFRTAAGVPVYMELEDWCSGYGE